MSIKQAKRPKTVKPPIPSLTFTIPRLKTFRLWCGLYGGHYDIIVFFRKKPTHFEHDRNEDGTRMVDLYAEHKADNIFADFNTGDFELWCPGWLEAIYPVLQSKKYPRPKATEIREDGLLQIDLAVPVDPENPKDIYCPSAHVDW